jgi:hypothetical protein
MVLRRACHTSSFFRWMALTLSRQASVSAIILSNSASFKPSGAVSAPSVFLDSWASSLNSSTNTPSASFTFIVAGDSYIFVYLQQPCCHSNDSNYQNDFVGSRAPTEAVSFPFHVSREPCILTSVDVSASHR